MRNFTLCAFADEAGNELSAQIDALYENKLNGLEIRGVDGQNISEISTEKAKEIRKRLEDKGLFVWSIGSPMGKINITDDFNPHLDSFKRTLEIANVLNAKAFRLFSFFMPKEQNPDDFKDEVIDRLSSFCDAAKDSGVVLCHENEKGIYGDNAVRCATIHKALPELKAVFDPANFIQSNQDTLEAWDLLSEYVYYLHIKDAVEGGAVVPAGDGIGNLPQIIEKFYNQGGRVLTLEPHLKVFSGLQKLEREGDKSVVGSVSYPSHRLAFDAAVNALKNII